jgi:hypothetical protein
VVKGERHRDIEQALGRLANNKAGRLELRGKLAEMLGVIAERVGPGFRSVTFARDATRVPFPRRMETGRSPVTQMLGLTM